MKNMTKITVFDQCVNGDINNFTDILREAFDQFDSFYRVCKNNIGAKNINSVKYDGIENNRAKFTAICTDMDKISEFEVNNEIEIERNDKGLIFNILIRGECE